MHIRTGPELGLRNTESYRPLKQGPNIENLASIPGSNMVNRQRQQEDQAASAVRPGDAQTVYKVKGAHIDTQA